MLSIVVAAAIATATPPIDPLSEAAHAIAAGRLDQARTMVANAVATGASGASVERLLADLAYQSGSNSEALARYQALLAQKSDDPVLAERAGIAALRTGDTAGAAQLLDRATRSPGASWRGWNAQGVVADLRHDWAAADSAYDEADKRAPGQSQIYNNRGWSMLLRGNWSAAVPLLARAAELDPKSARIADNLELARAAEAVDLPNRRPRESDHDWAARLNDAGIAARSRGETGRAIAAFSRAIEARTMWYARAANNLKLAQSAQ